MTGLGGEIPLCAKEFLTIMVPNISFTFLLSSISTSYPHPSLTAPSAS